MQNKIGRSLPQIREHRLERSPIPVHIRYDRDSHLLAASLASTSASVNRRSRI
jgi:hypothetical protein